MSISIQTVNTKKSLKDFIYLTEKIHANHNNWLPPVYWDEWKFYDPKYNRSLLSSEVILFIAYRDGILAGRITGIINNKYNARHNQKTGRFFNFDCYDDPLVSHSLLQSVEKWAYEKGMTKLIGPFGFSEKDPQGMQIEGFENLSVIATATNLPYLPILTEKEGYTKEIDCLVYKLDVPEQMPLKYQRIYERLSQNANLKIIEFTSRKELKPFIIPVLKLVNEAYHDLFGFVEMDEPEMHLIAKQYLPILDPAFTKLVTDGENNPIAFVIASPDVSEGIIKAKGRLFPLGFWHILRSAKKTKQLDLFLGAVKNRYQGYGLTALLGVSLMRTAQKRGMKFLDSHLILETNKPMRDVMEGLGATVYKKYRIYKKFLQTGG